MCTSRQQACALFVSSPTRVIRLRSAHVKKPDTSQVVRVSQDTHEALAALLVPATDSLGKVVAALVWHAGRIDRDEWKQIATAWVAEQTRSHDGDRAPVTATRYRVGKDKSVSSEPLKGSPKLKVWEPEPKGKGKMA